MTVSDPPSSHLSLAEIEALCRKAARGSGCPWGMAEEAGKVARWLAAHALPGPEALAALLSAPRHCRCSGAGPAPHCALALGAELSDEASAILDRGGRAFGAVAQPLLLLAQAGQSAAALGVPLTIAWTGFRATCSPHGLSIEQAEARDTAVAADVACGVAPIPAVSHPPEARSRPVGAAALAALEALAANTYAPASEASRTSGAGAANLDKD
jgi:hypothetical protein